MKETICTAFGLVGGFIAARLDVVLGTSYVRAGVCIAFLCNEVISILENAGLMGVPLPYS